MINDSTNLGTGSLFMGGIQHCTLSVQIPFTAFSSPPPLSFPLSFIQAEEFHSVVHVLLEWLAEAEQALRFHGNLPDDEESLRTLIDQHRVSEIIETVLALETRFMKRSE